MIRYKTFVTIIWLLVIFYRPINAFTQVINGVVLDNLNNPIPYVSIGIIGGNYGTISNDSGKFSILSKKIKPSDTLRFSSIGYFSKDIVISNIQNTNHLIMILEEQTYSINDVIIRPKNNKSNHFGNKKIHSDGWGFGGIGKGWELARLYPNSKTITLKEFQFHVRNCDYDSILFRINIYSNLNGAPDKIFNHDPIYVKSAVKNGWIKHDLFDYDLIMETDFFISIEAVEGWMPRGKTEGSKAHLILSGRVDKEITYKREYCLGYWGKSDMLMDYYLTFIE